MSEVNLSALPHADLNSAPSPGSVDESGVESAPVEPHGHSNSPTEAAPARAGTSAVHTARRKAAGDWTLSTQSLLMTIVIAVFVITFVVQAFQIPSESMEKTLLIGDYLLVDKARYGSPPGIGDFLLPYRPIRRGDIIVFHYPVKPTDHFVKRVIGLPGDRIHLVHKHVYVNGQPLSEPYVIFRRGSFETFRDNFPGNPGLYNDVTTSWYLQMRKLVHNGELVVPPDSYFVLGDNRDNSLDSRFWGLVPRENIVGRPLLIYWSMVAAAGANSAEAPPPDGKLSSSHLAFERLLPGIRWRRMLRVVE